MPGISTDNYSLEIAAYADAADIALVNRNTTKIDAIMADNRQISIDMYDSTLTYNTDDLAGHENAQNRIAVYRCLEDNVTGPWDSTKWVQTNLADEITGLRGGGGSGNVTNTATGNPVEFTDGADAPFVGLTSTIQGSQSGSGTPSPENARPFTVYTQASATVADDDTDPTKTTTYTVSFSSYNPVYKGSVNYVNKSGIIEMWAVSLGSGSWTKYTESGGTFFSSYFPKDMRLSTEEYLCSHYAPKSGETLGDCEIEIKIRTGESYDLVIIRDDSKSDMSYSQFETWLSTNGVRLVYTLSTPRTVDFTLDTVRALKGSNYITSTTGDLTVEYITEGYQPLVNPDDFVGATSSANGEHGLVPAPSISDREKYLKGDGTWGTITPGATTFAGLTDTDITNPSDGQAALYDETSGKWVNSDLPDADVTKTASGNPIEFSDGADAPLVKCVTQITGSQDLHGYDKPWVGGAGKNKLQTTGTSTTTGGVTFTVNDDGTVKVNGTATGVTTWIIGWITIESGETYTLSGSPNNPSVNSYWIDVRDGSSIYNNWTEDTPTYTATETKQVNVRIRIASGYTINNLVFKPQIEVGSTATSFAPYSNICPITAYTEGKIEVRGKNLYSSTDVSGTRYVEKQLSAIIPAGTYVISCICTSTDTTYSYCGFNQVYTDDTSPSDVELFSRNTRTSRIITFMKPVKAIRFYASISYTASAGCIFTFADIQIEKGSTATDYEPYTSTTHTTTYPSAIYRGSEDVVNGEVTSEKVVLTLNTADMNNNYDSYPGWKNCGIKDLIGADKRLDITNATMNIGSILHINTTSTNDLIYFERADYNLTQTEWKALAIDVQIVVDLPTPTTSSVTPTNLPVKSLLGYNHIESSTGDMEIEYFPAKEQPLIDLIPEASNMHTYSTAEQVVGKWVDGKNVYEKTYVFSSLQRVNDWTAFDEDCGIDTLVDYSLMFTRQNGQIDNDSDELRVAYNPPTGLGNLCYYPGGVEATHITVRYTKTSSNNRSLAKSSPQEETKEEQVEELKEEPTEEIKEETEEPVEEVKEEVKEEETKEEGEVNER